MNTMPGLSQIKIDLEQFKIHLGFKNSSPSLVVHFNTPSRKFYFSLIALIVHEMQQQSSPGFVYIRKHELLLKSLDDVLAGPYASKNIDGMWEKIRKAWHYSLPNLEEAAHFKIEGRDLVPPFEKGGKYHYECSENGADIWAGFFGVDEITNKWRFKVAVDDAELGIGDIVLVYGNERGADAWQTFLRLLEKPPKTNLASPDDEPATPMVQSLKKRIIKYTMAGVTVILLILAATSFINRALRPNMLASIQESSSLPSIAVLPFVNVNNDPDKDFFCDGITVELINNLARIKNLRVISRTSTFYYKGKNCDIGTICNNLDVEYILEGSIRFSGDRLRIAIQLIHAEKDDHIWSETFDREMENIFDLQEELTLEVIEALSAELLMPDMSLQRGKGTRNIDAYLNYLQALQHRFKLTPADNKLQRQYLLKAIEIDPAFSSAYALLAQSHILDIRSGATDSPDKTLATAMELAQKAISLDDSNADAYLALGWVHRLKRNHGKAVENARMAVQLAPNYAFAVIWLGIELMFMDRLEEAIPYFEKAILLDPKSLGSYWSLGETYRNLGQYKKAIDYLLKAKAQQPRHYIVHLNLAACYAELGQSRKATASTKRVLELKPDFTLKAWSEYLPYKNRERVDKWIASLRKAGLPE